MALTVITKPGFTGMALTNVTTAQAQAKAESMATLYEEPVDTQVSGNIDTDIVLPTSGSQFLSVTYDAISGQFQTDYQGQVTLYPPASNGGLWEMVELWVAVSGGVRAKPESVVISKR